MPEEMESPVEKLQEDLHEAAEHAKEAWLKWSALLSALFAVLAAISGLQSAHYESDAMLEQIAASDQWSYYQAKGIKANLAETETALLKQLGKEGGDAAARKQEKYRAEQDKIKEEAEALQKESRHHLAQHETLSYAVTFCQIAIAMIAISVLTKRRRFLLVAGALGVAGAVLLVRGLLL